MGSGPSVEQDRITTAGKIKKELVKELEKLFPNKMENGKVVHSDASQVANLLCSTFPGCSGGVKMDDRIVVMRIVKYYANHYSQEQEISKESIECGLKDMVDLDGSFLDTKYKKPLVGVWKSVMESVRDVVNFVKNKKAGNSKIVYNQMGNQKVYTDAVKDRLRIVFARYASHRRIMESIQAQEIQEKEVSDLRRRLKDREARYVEMLDRVNREKIANAPQVPADAPSNIRRLAGSETTGALVPGAALLAVGLLGFIGHRIYRRFTAKPRPTEEEEADLEAQACHPEIILRLEEALAAQERV